MFTVTSRMLGENNKDYSYRVIKEAIMTLELKPGQGISEVELAEALNISRTPIREVMAKLREEHLVEVLPQVGTYVSKIKSQLIEEAAFMRFTLEKEVLKLACDALPRDMIFDLKKNVLLQEELIGSNGRERDFHKLDLEFHHTIFHGLGKENVWGAIARLSTHYNRIRLLSEMNRSFQVAITQHQEIIEIIENKDKEKVDNIVREHIVEPIKFWKNLYSEESPYVSYFDISYRNPVFN
jgi:GntR family transcriptional regulator, rspAB operon transcriptional repressor